MTLLPTFQGNLGQIFSQEGWQFHRDIVKQYGGIVKLYGLCGNERLYVSDPKALRRIINEDQDTYEESKFFTKTNRVCFGPGIIAVIGEQHRKQCRLMGPVFSVHHLRGLTPIFHRISHELVDVLKRKFIDHGPGAQLEIEMLYWLKRTALEVVGQGGLGYSFGPLDSATTNEYSESVKNFAPTLFQLSILRQFVPFLSSIGPAWLRRSIVRVLPIQRVQRLREIVDVMDKTVRTIYAEKSSYINAEDKALVNEGRDISSILLQENMKSSEEDKLSCEEILGQMSAFIFAGQDTTSAALVRILQTLAEHPGAQTRLRNELLEALALARGDLAYDCLHALPFLDAIVRETLRLHPPVFMLHRVTTRDTVLPLSVPIHSSRSQAPISAIPLRKNTNIIIAIDAANRRTDVFGPDAEQWRPERWLAKEDPEDESRGEGSHEDSSEKASVDKLPGVYSGLTTFIGGGRSCIGFNFALLEIKVVLAALVPTFHFDLPADKELAWKLGGIVSPGVKDDPVPKLPLRPSLVSDRTSS